MDIIEKYIILAYRNNKKAVLDGMEELTLALAELSEHKNINSGINKCLSAIQNKDLTLLGDSLLCDVNEYEMLLKTHSIDEEYMNTAEISDIVNTLLPGFRAFIWAEQFETSDRKRALCYFGSPESDYFVTLAERFSADSVLIVFDPEGSESILDLKEDLISGLNFYLLEGLCVACEPGLDAKFDKLYLGFITEINSARERILVNKNTLARFKSNASDNVLINIPMLKNANLVPDLRKIIPAEVPVIIVSAGPSLDKNIEQLKKAKGHALIFAVDTALKYMMQHDIMPDLAITVEPIKPMANYQDDRCFDIPHIFDCESNPEIVGRHRERKFIINCRDTVKLLLERLGISVETDIAGGGSVATSAFAVCYQLGLQHIILIGQDLAYDGEFTHAGAVESKGINNTVEYEYVEGIYGGMVRTRCDWLGYLKWFENSIVAMKETKPQIEVIDATEGGALIHGTKVMSLEEAINSVCAGIDYDFATELKRLPVMLDEKAYLRLEDLLKGAVNELRDVKAAAGSGALLCAEAVSKLEAGNEKELALMLSKAYTLRKSCEQAVMFPLINNYAVSDIADEVNSILMQYSGREAEFRQMLPAFEAISKACDHFLTFSSGL